MAYSQQENFSHAFGRDHLVLKSPTLRQAIGLTSNRSPYKVITIRGESLTIEGVVTHGFSNDRSAASRRYGSDCGCEY